MDSSTLLDYALFQLTPTRTRCVLVLFRGGKSEELASGLFEPFISHLKFAKDQISKGGYSIKLCPPANRAPWFTKGTFERFVRFVSTPALLERFVSLEMEILQIERSVQLQANESLNTHVAGQVEEESRLAANIIKRKSSDPSKLKGELERSDDAVPEENSKIQLQRLLETRKTLLHKEQAMAYARGLVAGFDMDNIDDLIAFADAFGASRLRQACINFKELCNKKRGDGLWMEELATMQACPLQDLSFLGTSGIVLANEISAPTNGSDLTASHADDNSATSDQIPSTTAKVQMPMPWPNQLPHYMYNFPYQGYPFPPMQPVPYPYPSNVQWAPNMKAPSRTRREKFPNGAGNSYSDHSSDSEEEEGSDPDSQIQQDEMHSSVDTPYRKKHRKKKSSEKVVIRNINYITPKRRNGVSDKYSSDEDEFVDEESLKQQVDDAVGPLERLRKSNSGGYKKKGSLKSRHISDGSSDAPAQDIENDLISDAANGGKKNGIWDSFQNLLMREEKATENVVQRLSQVDVQDEQFTIRSVGHGTSLAINGVGLESEKPAKQRIIVDDSFVVSQRDGGPQRRVSIEDFEDAEKSQLIIRQKKSTHVDLVISQRLEGSGSGLGGFLPSGTESSIIKPGLGEDWVCLNHSGRPENQDATKNVDCLLTLDDYSNAGKRRKDVLVDDSFIIDSRPATDDPYDSQWKTDISMAADLTLSCRPENDVIHDKREEGDAYVSSDLCMVLARDSGLESARDSRVEGHLIDIPFMETERRSSSIEPIDHAEKLTANGDKAFVKKNETSRTKVPGKELKPKVLHGSIRKSKTEMMSKGNGSALIRRTPVRKSKQEQEEELRKKMEELMIQRHKRIAERTAAGGLAPGATKKVPSDSKLVTGSIKSDKSRISTTTRRQTR